MESLTAADRVQIELFRRATPEQRAALAGRLSDDMMRLSRTAIREANPHLDEWRQRVKFVELHYGKELAIGLERDLRRRGLIRDG